LLSIIEAAGWPIWPLIFCSIIALALIIERFLAFRRPKISPDRLLEDAINATRGELPSSDLIRQIESGSLLGSVLASGLVALRQSSKPSPDELRATMEGAGKRAEQQLNMRLTTLATIASSAPLLGLLGTVVGMIEIFGGQSTSGGNNPAQLAHGISVALYNTAFGLIVAIPSLMFWRYFKSQADNYLLEMELAADRFARHLKSQFRL
jgi:biopolymer transport protein ExbB